MLHNPFFFNTGQFDDFPALKQLEKKTKNICFMHHVLWQKDKKQNAGKERMSVTSMLTLFLCIHLCGLI